MDVDQADQIAGVFGDQPVLFLASAQGLFGVKAGLLDGSLLQSVGDRAGETLEAGLQDVIIRPFANALHGDFLRPRAGHQDERDVQLALAQQMQRLERVEFREGEVRQDNVRASLLELAQQRFAVLYPSGMEGNTAALQLLFDQFRIMNDVFDNKNIKFLLHAPNIRVPLA